MRSGDYELAEGADAGKVPGELRIAFVGRLAEEKNVDVLIEALSLLPNTLEHVVLDIAGGGELREALEQKAHDCGVSDRVISVASFRMSICRGVPDG